MEKALVQSGSEEEISPVNNIDSSVVVFVLDLLL